MWLEWSAALLLRSLYLNRTVSTEIHTFLFDWRPQEIFLLLFDMQAPGEVRQCPPSPSLSGLSVPLNIVRFLLVSLGWSRLQLIPAVLRHLHCRSPLAKIYRPCCVVFCLHLHEVLFWRHEFSSWKGSPSDPGEHHSCLLSMCAILPMWGCSEDSKMKTGV